MRTIQPTEILAYYDGVEVFAAQDSIGGHYVGAFVDAAGDADRYLVVGVRPARLRELRAGMLDLRTLLLEAPGYEWYLTLVNGDAKQPLTLEPQSGSLAATDFLPEDGFLLDDSPIDDLALQQARERHNVIFEFSVEPPETAAGHRVSMTTLGSLLLQMQTMVKHAYQSALRELSTQAKNSIDTRDGHLMDVVVPAASGSYRVVLEAAKPPDMFGYGELARALKRLDDVFASADNPDTAREMLQPYKGHLAGSYIKLMRFLADHQTGLWYAWADPNATVGSYRGVSEAGAGKLAELLSDITSLGAESVTVSGTFQRFNRSNGTWGLFTEEGVRTGQIADNGPSMDGLQVGGFYRFECTEEIEVDFAGREKRTYYLRSIVRV